MAPLSRQILEVMMLNIEASMPDGIMFYVAPKKSGKLSFTLYKDDTGSFIFGEIDTGLIATTYESSGGDYPVTLKFLKNEITAFIEGLPK